MTTRARVAIAVACAGWCGLIGAGAAVYGAISAYADCPDIGGHMFVKYIEPECRADRIADTLPWATAVALTPLVIVGGWRLAPRRRDDAVSDVQ